MDTATPTFTIPGEHAAVIINGTRYVPEAPAAPAPDAHTQAPTLASILADLDFWVAKMLTPRAEDLTLAERLAGSRTGTAVAEQVVAAVRNALYGPDGLDTTPILENKAKFLRLFEAMGPFRALFLMASPRDERHFWIEFIREWDLARKAATQNA